MTEIDHSIPTNISEANTWWDLLIQTWEGTEEEPQILQFIKKLCVNESKHLLTNRILFQEAFLDDGQMDAEELSAIAADSLVTRNANEIIMMLNLVKDSLRAKFWGDFTLENEKTEIVYAKNNFIQLSETPVNRHIKVTLPNGKAALFRVSKVIGNKKLEINIPIAENLKIEVNYEYTKLKTLTYRALKILDLLISESHTVTKDSPTLKLNPKIGEVSS